MRVQPVDEGAWWEALQSCPHATFFHSPTWATAATLALPGAVPAALGVGLDDGTPVVLPLVRTGRHHKVMPVYRAGFAGTYGDPLSPRALTAAEHRAVLRSVCRPWVAQLQLVGNPFAAGQPDAPFGTSEADTTQVLWLDGGHEALWKGYNRAVRKQVNKGRRAELTVRPAVGAADLDAYYALYEQNLAHWGGAVGHPKALFAYLLAEPPRFGTRSVLWLCHGPDGSLAGGTLVLYAHHHAVEWHAVFDRAWFRHGARNFLVDAIIQDACRSGLRVYDFNPSGAGGDGTRAFKAKFGAVELALVRWSWRNERAGRLLGRVGRLRSARRWTRPLRKGA